MRKKVFIGLSILIVLLALVIIGGMVARAYAMEALTQSLNRRLMPLGFSVQLHPDAMTAPLCVRSLEASQNGSVVLRVNHICIRSGALSLMSDAPDIAVSTGEISGTLLYDEKKGAQNDQGATSESQKKSKWDHAFVDVELGKIDVRVGSKDRNLRIHARHGHVQMDRGVVSGALEFTPGFELGKMPFAVQNIPSINLTFNGDLHAHTGEFQTTFSPELSLIASVKNQTIEAHIGALSGALWDDSAELNAMHVGVQLNGVKLESRFDALRAKFDQKMPSADALKTILVERPQLRINLSDLTDSECIQAHPVLNNIVAFWKQDPGAYLGKAPKQSVRRKDVLKSKTQKNIPKNPISEETRKAIREGFMRVQEAVASLPVIQIQNGTIEAQNGDQHFVLDDLNLSSDALFKDKQQFDAAFKIHDADIILKAAYPDDSALPTFEFKIQRLDAQSFLRLLNLPIPEKNDGSVSFQLRLSGNDDAIFVSGNIESTAFAFFHPKISPNLINNINAALHFDAEYRFADDSLSVQPLSFHLENARADGFLRISDLRSNPLIEVKLKANDIPCADIPKLIPDGLLPTITSLEIVGSSISPEINAKIPWRNPLTASLTADGFENRCMPTAVLPHHPEEIDSDLYVFSTTYTYFTDMVTVGPGSDSFTPLEDIPPYVQAAMYMTEDKRFFEHGPLRVAFIERALRLNLNLRKYVYGGSTIGQQLTKNLFLSRDKNLARKLEEAFITWYLVTHVPRLRIFELYLNVIEFGPDIYGIKNAAAFYFNKLPKELTPLEGAFLASLKVSPSKGGGFYSKGFPKDGKWWHKRLKYILKILAQSGYIAPHEILAAYDWTPTFDYPEDKEDPRALWLEKYNQYRQEQNRLRKQNADSAPEKAHTNHAKDK